MNTCVSCCASCKFWEPDEFLSKIGTCKREKKIGLHEKITEYFDVCPCGIHKK